MKQPALMWYPGDNRRDTAVQSCCFEARGLWREMMDLMHDGEPYGHLTAGGVQILPPGLSRIVGIPLGRVKKYLKELEDRSVFSRTAAGVIFSRRMVRDDAFKKLRIESGRQGGNRKLGVEYNLPGFVYVMGRKSDSAVKIGISKSPAKRLYKIRCQFPADQIELLAQEHVDDMGASEAHLHSRFAEFKSGEWFALPADSRVHLINRLGYHLRVKVQVNGGVNGQHSPPPALAVAVASAVASPPPPRDGAQSPNGSTAQTLVSVVPAEFRPDMQRLLESIPNVTAWTAEMRAALEGMHGSPLTFAQLGQAVRDYLASGKLEKSGPSLRQFRRYMQGVLEVGGIVPLGLRTNGKRNGRPEYDYSNPTNSIEDVKWQT